MEKAESVWIIPKLMEKSENRAENPGAARVKVRDDSRLIHSGARDLCLYLARRQGTSKSFSEG